MKYAPHAILLALFATLLVGQRFGFVWAGGTGYVREVGAYDETGFHYERGETVSTGSDRRTYLRVGTPGDIAALAEIWMDYNTEITLEATNENGVTVRLSKGRVYAVAHDPTHPFAVRTNYVESTIVGGTISVVNYDFRETVSVIPIGTAATITPRDGKTFSTEKPVDIHETPPVSVSEFSFDPSSGSAADFYAWADRRIAE